MAVADLPSRRPTSRILECWRWQRNVNLAGLGTDDSAFRELSHGLEVRAATEYVVVKLRDVA